MKKRDNGSSALSFFWEQADSDGIGENPLVVELCYRLDAVARYRGMISDAEAAGQDDVLADLVGAHDREEQIVRRLRSALYRTDPQYQI
jgi:hypothetical protein